MTAWRSWARNLLGKVVKAIVDGTAPRTPQDESQYTYAPMLSRDMSPIDWSRPALDIHNQIRGLVPWPATTMELAGTKFKVFAAFLTGETSDQPGRYRFGCGQEGHPDGLRRRADLVRHRGAGTGEETDEGRRLPPWPPHLLRADRCKNERTTRPRTPAAPL